MMGQNKGLNATYRVVPGFHTNTQLQFNLDAPTVVSLESKFKSPQAILIQHLGAPKDNMYLKGNPKSPVKYTHLSGSKLSTAMQLAKDDLKLAKRRKAIHEFANDHGLVPEYEEQFTERILNKRSSIRQQKSPRHLQVYKEVHVIDESAQKSSLYGKFKQPPLHVQKSSELLELEQLQQQLRDGLEQLKRILEQAHHIKHPDYDPQEEARLLLKHIEQSRKMSRTLYTLQHQVQSIKSNIGMKNNRNMNKRVHIHKLASSYRGLVRLLQTFFSSVPEKFALGSDVGTMMYNYNEISKLVRELSLCCLQLQVNNVGQVNIVLTLLDQIANIDVKSKTKVEKSPTKVSTVKNKPLKTNKAFSRGYLTPKPHRSIMKRPPYKPQSVTRPPTPISSSTPNENNDPNDLFSRPVWVPPSHSPNKHIAPVALGGLGDSLTFPPSHDAAGKKRKATKNLRFENDTKEYDIDSLPKQPIITTHDANLRSLKNDLLQELESKLQQTVNPLVTRVEQLAKGQATTSRQPPAPTNDDVVMNTLVEDAAQEITRLRSDKQTTLQAHTSQNAPDIEVILKQIEAMEKEEMAIRQKWRQIDYDPVDVHEEEDTPQVVEPLSDPRPMTYTHTKPQETKPKMLVKFVEDAVEYSAVDLPKLTDKTSLHKLSLSESSMHAISHSRDGFKRHLRSTFHEAKGSFDPWQLVEDLSDEILDEVISSVNIEMDALCNEFASALYQDEFVEGHA